MPLANFAQMKRLLSLFVWIGLAVSVFPPVTARAQQAARPVHVGLGVSAGTVGVGGELAVQFGRQVALRGGYSFFPVDHYTFSFTLPESYGGDGTPSQIDARLSMNHAYFLSDFYVFPNSNFRLSAGLWAGRPDFLTIQNLTPLPEAFNSIGIDVDGYSVHAKDGDITIGMKVNGFKPYLGFGFGRMRDDRRVGVSCDLGVLGTFGQGLRAMGYGLFDEKEVQLTSAVADGKDKGLLDLVGGLKIYPVIRVNLFFKIF